MNAPARYPFISKGTGGPVPDLAPIVPINLTRGGVSIGVNALVDSGADVSILPYSVGVRFGIDWHSLTLPCSVGGSAGGIPGKMLVVDAVLHTFPAVKLVFAWVQSDSVPVLLGQTNFFLEFDVCFFRSRGEFQIQPATP